MRYGLWLGLADLLFKYWKYCLFLALNINCPIYLVNACLYPFYYRITISNYCHGKIKYNSSTITKTFLIKIFLQSKTVLYEVSLDKKEVSKTKNILGNYSWIIIFMVPAGIFFICGRAQKFLCATQNNFEQL